MTRRKLLHLVVIVLSLLLPLHALAGQWLGCTPIHISQGLSQSATYAEDAQPSETLVPPCHQAMAKLPGSTAQEAQGTVHDDAAHSCQSCQFLCHWHCVLLMETTASIYPDPRPHYISFENPSPLQPVPTQPQRPPQPFTA